MIPAALKLIRKPEDIIKFPSDFSFTPLSTTEASIPSINRVPFSYKASCTTLTYFAGIGQSVKDFNSALEFLDQELSLGLTQFQKNYYEQILLGLSAIIRFNGDSHIITGDSTAVHQAHCCILGQEIFKRSGAIDTTTSPKCKHPRMEALRLACHLGFFIHDSGEFLAEPSSVASRSTTRGGKEGDGEVSGSEKVSLELQVAKLTHIFAVQAAKAKEDKDFNFLAQIRNLINIIRLDALDTLSSKGTEGVTDTLFKHLPHFEYNLSQGYQLEDEQKDQIDNIIQLMTLIDSPEEFFSKSQIDHESLEGTYLLFYRTCVKAIETLQGNRFFKNFFVTENPNNKLYLFTDEDYLRSSNKVSQKGYSIPVELSESNRALNNLRFSEKHLAPLFKYAQKLREFTEIDFSPELQLASAIRDSMFLSFIEMIQHLAEFTERHSTSQEHLEKCREEERQIQELRKNTSFTDNPEEIIKRINARRRSYLEELKKIHLDDNLNFANPELGPRVISRNELQTIYLEALVTGDIGKLDSTHPMSRGTTLVDDLTIHRLSEVRGLFKDLKSREIQTNIRDSFRNF